MCVCSSLSQWVHACDALELPSQQREQLDTFIDQLYKDIDTGHFSCRLPPVYRARPLTHWSVYLRRLNPSLCLTSGSSSTAETETHILPLRRPSICVKYDCFVQKCEINQSDERLSHFFLLQKPAISSTARAPACSCCRALVRTVFIRIGTSLFAQLWYFNFYTQVDFEWWESGQLNKWGLSSCSAKRDVKIYEGFLCCTGNHSCVPNAEASFPDNNFLLHLAALSDISPGEVRGAC